MFGIVAPGRPVDTSFQQVDANKFLIVIADAQSINHVVLFLTGVPPLPLTHAACIFFSLPDPSAPPTWHYLGALTNQKQSAIYKITNLSQSHKLNLTNGNSPAILNNTITPTAQSSLVFNYVQAPVNHVAQIGISLEPVESVSQMVPAVETTASNLNMFAEFIYKTVGNMYNYCVSYSRPLREIVQHPTEAASADTKQFVPLASIQAWYEAYTNRLKNDPNFWKTLN